MSNYKIPVTVEAGLQRLLARCRRSYTFDPKRRLFVWRFNGAEYTGKTGEELVYNLYKAMSQ